MNNISFLACTKVRLWELKVCIAVNGEKFQSHTVTLTLVRQCPISNLSELISYATNYNVFRFHVPRSISFLFIGQKHTLENTHIHMDAHKTLTSTL